MIKKLFDPSYRRTAGEAAQFYVIYSLLGMVFVFISFIVVISIMAMLSGADESNAREILRQIVADHAGSIFRYTTLSYCFILLMIVLWAKSNGMKYSKNHRFRAMLINYLPLAGFLVSIGPMLGVVFPFLFRYGGVFLGLIPIAYLTTKENIDNN